MKQEELTGSTDGKLLQEQKKKKSNKISTFIIGMLIGVSVYSAIENGFEFFTFFPLIIAYFFFRQQKKDQA
ncbi:hypothetical protein [Roseivirga echinicomitans]|uniref:FUSC family protein n=1 Tax=Roseivirga echinicomitans TaxID=296218 RepID=A0A150WZ25_9BACT|nr:hypothetical protein [Roseivirga echinicomitans]KYG71542.1 hypothetical protein AWN68_12415 [Roseivirga echinicomitans]